MMEYYAESNKGCLRELNEDNYCCGSSHGGTSFYFAVADGLGGHNAGEAASRIAVDLFAERLPFVETTEIKTAGKCITEIIEKANRRILNAADEEKSLSGMGTTAVIGVVDKDNVLTVGNAGDSRAYLLSENGFTKLTTDHTYVEYLVGCGMLKREEAANHPDRSMLTKALGIDEVVEPDIFTFELKSGDRLLFCSDGLYVMLGDEIIKEKLENKSADVESICRELVRLAIEAGGHDNVTVIVAEI